MIQFRALSLALLLFASLCQADDDVDQTEARALKEAGIIRPLRDILDASEKIRSGRILEVELEKKHDRYVYEIEIADQQGKVWEMKFDAKTATLISQEQED